MRRRVIVQGSPRLLRELRRYPVQGDVHRVRPHHLCDQAGQIEEREVTRATSFCHFARRASSRSTLFRIDRTKLSNDRSGLSINDLWLSATDWRSDAPWFAYLSSVPLTPRSHSQLHWITLDYPSKRSERDGWWSGTIETYERKRERERRKCRRCTTE